MTARRQGLLGAVVAALLALPLPAHATETRLRGLLDMALSSSDSVRALGRLTMGDSNLDAYRLRLFLDARLSPQLEVHVQTILHEGLASLRADGAYALWTPLAGHDLSLEAGKIPSLIGVYAPRAYSDQNWLMGTPLLYHYHTSLPWGAPVTGPDELVGIAGEAQPNGDPAMGYLPVVDERWWDTGAAVLGSERTVEYALGVTQGSPSWPSPGRDDTPGQTLAGRVGWVPVAGVRVGVSGADGTWMPWWFSYALPAGRSLRDYRERTLMTDLELARGALEFRAEGVVRDWETLTTGTLTARGGYAEARWGFANGSWLALRSEALRFSRVDATSGRQPWDAPVDRTEAVFGVRVTREVRLKLGAQRNVRYRFGASRLTDDGLLAALGIRF